MDYILFRIFNIISVVGGIQMMLITSTLVCIFILFLHKERRLAGFIMFNYGITMSIVVIIKHLVQKGRSPAALVYENSYAYPSGHIAAATVTLLLLFHISKFVKNTRIKNFMKVLGIIWLLLIIIARLYLRVHDIYDGLASIIIAGYVFYISRRLKIFKDGILKKEVVIIK